MKMIIHACTTGNFHWTSFGSVTTILYARSKRTHRRTYRFYQCHRWKRCLLPIVYRSIRNLLIYFIFFVVWNKFQLLRAWMCRVVVSKKTLSHSFFFNYLRQNVYLEAITRFRGYLINKILHPSCPTKSKCRKSLVSRLDTCTRWVTRFGRVISLSWLTVKKKRKW